MNPIPKNRIVVFSLIAILGAWIDLSSKNAVFSHQGYPFRFSEWTKSWFGESITFRFYTSFNEGALWGLGQGFTFLFACLSMVAVIGIIYWLFWRGAAASWWLTVTLAFVMAGTLGNLYDRLGLPGYVVNGKPVYAVRDFLLFKFGTYHWPVFNIADVLLVTGAIMLLIASFFAPSHLHREAEDELAEVDNAEVEI